MAEMNDEPSQMENVSNTVPSSNPSGSASERTSSHSSKLKYAIKALCWVLIIAGVIVVTRDIMGGTSTPPTVPAMTAPTVRNFSLTNTTTDSGVEKGAIYIRLFEYSNTAGCRVIIEVEKFSNSSALMGYVNQMTSIPGAAMLSGLPLNTSGWQKMTKETGYVYNIFSHVNTTFIGALETQCKSMNESLTVSLLLNALNATRLNLPNNH